MTSEKHFEKSKIFLKEANLDLKIKCYNKVASSCWFSIEQYLRGLLISHYGLAPKATGRLIDKFKELIKGQRKRMEKELILTIQEIYNLRKNIDHGLMLIEEDEAKKIVEKTKKILGEIKSLIKKE